jgi:hypothetical protein
VKSILPIGRRALAAGLVFLALAAGCSLSVTRTRVNVPLDRETFKALEPGKTTQGEALATLGAPDKIEAHPDKDYLWWLHRDTSSVGLSIESPVSFVGYRHRMVELDVNALDTSAMRLTFDHANGTLVDKSLRLSPAYEERETAKPGWEFFAIPRYGLIPYSFGDAGEKSYTDLFGLGQLFGGYVGALPTPYFMFILGGNYQTYDGRTFHTDGHRVDMEDLHLYQLEAGGRFRLPPKFFVSFWDIDKLKELFYTEDRSRGAGFLIYFQWTVGGTVNEEVGAHIDGANAGSYFDKSIGLSTTIGTGVEYSWKHLGFQAGIDYQVVAAPKGGDAPLDTSAADLQNLVLTAGVMYRF